MKPSGSVSQSGGIPGVGAGHFVNQKQNRGLPGIWAQRQNTVASSLGIKWGLMMAVLSQPPMPGLDFKSCPGTKPHCR